MNKTESILRLAISIALAFTLSCSGGDDDGLNGGSSSSSGGGGNNKCNDIANCKKKQIGSQNWMAENLNIDVSGSKCYDNKPANCDKYGRLYDWATAMALDASCNSSSCASKIKAKHQGICPSGWHIPSDDDWEELIDFVGGSSTAGTKLKARDGWNSFSGVPSGTDEFGFSALPGGYGVSDDYFYDVGRYGRWWSAAEDYYANIAYRRYMGYNDEDVFRAYDDKGYYLLSVRCLQD